VALGPVLVNAVFPDLAGLATDPEAAAAGAGVTLLDGEADLLRAAAEFRSERTALQLQQLDRMAEELPLPQVRLPYLFTSELGRAELDLLAAAVTDGIRHLDVPGVVA
jgi:hypothetical protein